MPDALPQDLRALHLSIFKQHQTLGFYCRLEIISDLKPESKDMSLPGSLARQSSFIYSGEIILKLKFN